MKITDLTTGASSVPPKHIKLVACLQRNKCEVLNLGKQYFFHENRTFIINKCTVKEVIRLASIKLTDGEYDLIALHYYNGNTPNIFLGHWNDGTVE